MPLSLTLLASQVFSMVSNVFSKPRLFQILCSHFLVGVFQKIMSQQKRKASHPRIKEYVCSKPKHKFLTVSQPESANANRNECKGSFTSVVQKVQHSTVRIAKASSVSANTQSYASNNQTFQPWNVLEGFDESPQMNVLLCMLNDMFAMLKASGSYHRPKKEW